jgi:hypothetical protein
MATEYETKEWASLPLAVLEEVDGVCQHCKKRQAVTAHHLTYDYGIICPKKYLLAVCELCRGWKHHKIDHDPKDRPLSPIEKLQLQFNNDPHFPGHYFLWDARRAVLEFRRPVW